jgi:hypothetical protein
MTKRPKCPVHDTTMVPWQYKTSITKGVLNGYRCPEPNCKLRSDEVGAEFFTLSLDRTPVPYQP